MYFSVILDKKQALELLYSYSGSKIRYSVKADPYLSPVKVYETILSEKRDLRYEFRVEDSYIAIFLRGKNNEEVYA